jgi:hypothetical protein
LNLRFQDDVWRWNADRITAAFDLEYMAKKHLDGMDMDNTKSDPGSWQDVVDRTLQAIAAADHFASVPVAAE